jgi:hypothetical protein
MTSERDDTARRLDSVSQRAVALTQREDSLVRQLAAAEARLLIGHDEARAAQRAEGRAMAEAKVQKWPARWRTSINRP